jgi:carbamoylphosphate synthase small subunit
MLHGLSVDAVLELSDGATFRGISFGAEGKSVAGECVFQTGLFCWLGISTMIVDCQMFAYE